MKNYFKLSLDFEPLRGDFVFPISNSGNRTLHVYNKGALSDPCLAWMAAANLRFDKLFIFEDPGVNNVRIIHIDGLKNKGKKFAVNWNIAAGKFVMEWFDLKPNAREIINDAKHPYTMFDENDAILIEESDNKGPVLFNTSAPHSVMNLDNNIRYGVTLRFFNRLSYEESVNFLSKWVVL
jgi:hypothetical protein